MKLALTVAKNPLLSKIYFIMKVTTIFLFALCLQVHARGFGQASVNLKFKRTEINNILDAIEKQTSFRFLYNSDLQVMNQRVDIDVKEMDLKKVLDIILVNTGLQYKFMENNLVLVKYPDPPPPPPVKTVTGKVVGTNGLPLANVSVMLKGSQKGTTTNEQGAFAITVEDKDVLVFSYVGYEIQEVAIGNKTQLDIALIALKNNLDEIVVVGFGTTKRRDLTGAIVSLKPEEITARPGPNPMESLQGRVAGLDITRSSGQPGAPVTLQLRGTRSFTASGNPLFIINGLPGDYETLNPYDIESIEVLKDASSTAVYGSAGSNGVILITTKNGKAGKLSVDFNTYYGANGWSVTPTMRSGDAYLKTKRDAYKYVYDATANKWTTTGALWQSAADDEAIFGTARYQTYKEGNYVDWADVFLQKNAGTQNYSLGVSGGNSITKGYLSVNYTNEKGQYRGDDFKQFSTSMRIDHKVKSWLNLGANLQASYVDRNKAQDKLENALVTDPLVKPYNADGTLNTNLGNNVYNLLLDYQPGVYGNVDNNTKLFLNPYVEIKPIKGLSILSRAGVQFNYLNTYRFDGIGSVNYTYANANIAKARVNQNRFQGYQWENILSYNFKLKNVHDFTFTGVTSYYHNQNTNTEMNQSNITSNNFKWYKFSGDANTTAFSSYTMSKTFGVLGRLNYSYKGTYLLSASLRRDGSSVLYSTNRWNNFPAVSAGWRISDEKFMDGSKKWLDNLKLRIGWGITGSAKIDPYSSVSTLEFGNMSLGGLSQPFYRNTQFITNADLGWEKSNNTNIGLDATLLKNRIEMSVEYYITKTDGVIYSVLSPIIYGTYRPGTQYQTNINVAETKNRGFEFTLNTRNIVKKNFEWSSSLAFSHNSEEIVKLVGGTANNIPNGAYSLTLGEAVNSFRNYKLDGVWQIGEEMDALVFSKRPGDLKVNVPGMTKLADGVFVKDVNGVKTYYYNNLADAQKFNPTLTAASSKYGYSATDYQILGKNAPDWSLGFQNRFQYKSFDLTIYSYFRWGQMINYNMLGWYQPNGFATNASPSRTIPEYFNYWTPENPSNDFPVMNYQSSSSTIAGFSGMSYVDGSFFKIKNITLGYTLPSKLLKKATIQRLRVYGTITNPLVIANSPLIKQYDPEMNGSLEYPLTKQMVVGLNVTF
jgi:TonB-linked SusC/RagA family outer membrane protein